MMISISTFENIIAGLEGEVTKKDSELNQVKADLEKPQAKLDSLTNEFTAKKIKIIEIVLKQGRAGD